MSADLCNGFTMKKSSESVIGTIILWFEKILLPLTPKGEMKLLLIAIFLSLSFIILLIALYTKD